MKEDLLHFIWLHRKYPMNGLVSTTGETIFVHTPGNHNQLSGPDFFNAKIELDDQLWAGNVEIHLKSSDWYAHKHQEDMNYDNVILHVVWNDDVSVFRKDGTRIPTLSLRNYLSENLLSYYQKLFNANNYSFVNCERELGDVDYFLRNNWIDRLFVERLEQKSIYIDQLLKETNNNWEHVLFLMLLKNFGSNINGELFLALGISLDFSIVRKLYGRPLEMESLFMGQVGLLPDEPGKDAYHETLKSEFAYLKSKYRLEPVYGTPEFFKLRPSNFPTIRLSQLATVYTSNTNLFNDLVQSATPDLSVILNAGTSPYWETHYTFGKTSPKRKKNISKAFLELILINTIIPLKFCYQKYIGYMDVDSLLGLMLSTRAERNTIIEKFQDLGVPVLNAKDSQGYLHLYKEYCSKDKCLDCAIGAHLMNIKV